MAKATKFDLTAEEVLKAVGGQENVTNVSHCMTRLRFNLKDPKAASDDAVKKVPGVIGAVRSGGQFMVIIGQTVDEVYESVCRIGGFTPEDKVEENLDAPKQKVTFASVGNKILDALAGCLTPLIPLLMGASIFKMFVAILGPQMLNWLHDGSQTLTLFTFVGDAGFYFLPIVLGYTAARKFGATPVIGMFMGAILLHPTFVAMATAQPQVSFHVFGIPVHLATYSSTILPTILSVWVMSYVEKFFRKFIPPSLRTVFAPFLTILVMLPVSLCGLAPLGSFVGTWIGDALIKFASLGGIAVIIVMVLISALWEFIVMSGMHMVLITTMIVAFTQNGFEGLIMPCGAVASLATSGMALGVWLRLRNKEEKNLSLGFFIAAIIGGVTEPALYGLGIRYRRPFYGLMIGGAIGGLYLALTGTKIYTMVAVASFLGLTGFVGGSTTNLVNGLIGCILAFIVTAVATYFIGLPKEEVTGGVKIDIEAAMAGK